MTLDETWKNCLSMWRWIAKQRRAGSWQHVAYLKAEWLTSHGFEGIEQDCFFCDRRLLCKKTGLNKDNLCINCPARRVDKEFGCCTDEYNFSDKPIAFYNKLVSLNRKRLKK